MAGIVSFGSDDIIGYTISIFVTIVFLARIYQIALKTVTKVATVTLTTLLRVLNQH